MEGPGRRVEDSDHSQFQTEAVIFSIGLGAVILDESGRRVT